MFKTPSKTFRCNNTHKKVTMKCRKFHGDFFVISYVRTYVCMIYLNVRRKDTEYKYGNLLDTLD